MKHSSSPVVRFHYQRTLSSAAETNETHARWDAARLKFAESGSEQDRMALDDAERRLVQVVMDNSYILAPLKRTSNLPDDVGSRMMKRRRENISETVVVEVLRRLIGHPRYERELADFKARKLQYEADVEAHPLRVAEQSLGIRKYSKAELETPKLKKMPKPFDLNRDPTLGDDGEMHGTSFSSFLSWLLKTTTSNTLRSNADREMAQFELNMWYRQDPDIAFKHIGVSGPVIGSDLTREEIEALIQEAVKAKRITKRKAASIDREELEEAIQHRQTSPLTKHRVSQKAKGVKNLAKDESMGFTDEPPADVAWGEQDAQDDVVLEDKNRFQRRYLEVLEFTPSNSTEVERVLRFWESKQKAGQKALLEAIKKAPISYAKIVRIDDRNAPQSEYESIEAPRKQESA
jgi:hypothetical protein